VIHLARQLAHLLGEAGEVGERVEVPFPELADPGVDPALHGIHRSGSLPGDVGGGRLLAERERT
jgi:hypothetical protein